MQCVRNRKCKGLRWQRREHQHQHQRLCASAVCTSAALLLCAKSDTRKYRVPKSWLSSSLCGRRSRDFQNGISGMVCCTATYQTQVVIEMLQLHVGRARIVRSLHGLSMSRKHETWSPLNDSGMEEEPREELEEEPKVCQVCGDKATGYHFNAMTCEGCKGFFRRAMKGPSKFRCSFQNNCVITKSNRRQCQACRLQKCLSIGMLKELIMSDEAVEKRRMLIQRKRMVEEPAVLSQEQVAIIQELLDAHRKTFDMAFSGFIEFRPPDWNGPISNQLSPESHRKDEAGDLVEYHPSCDYTASISGHNEEAEPGDSKGKAKFTNLPHITDLGTYMIQHVIKYAKALHFFRSLNMEDQISLLKGAAFEIVQMRFNMLFNEETGIWECGSHKYCMNDAVRAGFQAHLLDPLLKLHFTLRRLHLHDEEYVLMQAISLFSADRPGVTQHSIIDNHQEMLAVTLKTYIEVNRSDPNKHLVFPKIMACLTEMRTMNEEHTKQILQIQDIQPDVSPLMLEIISKHT